MRPADLAERAALGSLLLNYSGAVDVARVLRPGDFLDPWHGEVFRVVRDRALAGHAIDPQATGAELIHRLGPTRAAVVRLADLIAIVPARPDPTAYARMVLNAALRREVEGVGVLLRAGALSAVLEASPRPMAAISASVDAIIDSAENRWRLATGRGQAAARLDPQPIGLIAGRSRLRGVDQALASERMLRAHPMPTTRELIDCEADLMASLVVRPETLGAVRAWLRPADVTDRGSRAVYAATLELADRGRSIDPVTVAWRVQRFDGPDPSALLERTKAVVNSDPLYLAQQVAANRLRLTADAAARHLATCATDPARELSTVFEATRTATVQLRDAANPLTTATPSRATQALAPAPARCRPVIEGRAG
jgi:replicative DNA helicase